MKARFLAVSVVATCTLLAASARAGEDPSYMPPNAEKIAAALMARGAVPKDATPEQLDAAVEAYLSKKMDGRDQANPLARKSLDANEAALDALSPSALRGKKLGTAPAYVAPSSPAWKSLAGAGKLLLILVEFSNTPFTWKTSDGKVRTEAGPLHNQIRQPDNSYDLWLRDFDRQHYEDMLFTPGGFTFPSDTPHYGSQRRGSMADYYLAQSYGKYTVGGHAYGWYRVNKPEAFYGDDDEVVGDVRHDLITDAVAAANAAGQIDWAAYDTNGDCIIDHPLFIHAGVDESGGGGAQGSDAIWAHSWDTWVQVSGPSATCPSGLYIYNYTIMPEDGGVGVFAHEFGHDLGLPDEYDTIYSGRGESIANWSIMSQGSWLGMPAQTEPSMMSIWARMSLGWVVPGPTGNLAVTSVANLAVEGAQVRLEQSERWGGAGTLNAVRVNLPAKKLSVNVPHSGTMEWFGGKADLLDTTLRRTVDLTGKTSASLSFWTWYDMEPSWDFGFVQVSTDGGATWSSLALPGTTSTYDPNAMPAIVANLPGFTGRSGGWVQKAVDLAPYLGKVVQLQFRSMTDWGTTGAGFYVDDVTVVANGATVFTDGVETADPTWTVAGWTRDPGYTYKAHYYLAEWRNFGPMETPWNATSILNFDVGLTHATQFDAYGSTGNPNQPWNYPYSPGLVLWYRDTSYTDNWTRAHIGHGYLLVVDAHDQAILRPSTGGVGTIPWNTHVQSSDAAFSLDKTPALTLGYWGRTRTYAEESAMPAFDDSHTYWSTVAPDASTLTPRYGLVFRVVGEAADRSAAVVGFGTK